MPNSNQVAGALPFDENRKEIQIGSAFLEQDGTAPFTQTSPLTLPGDGNATIVVPAGAAEFIVLPQTHDLEVSSDSGLSRYDLTVKGAKESYPCAGMQNIYLHGTSGDVVYFRFTMLGTS